MRTYILSKSKQGTYMMMAVVGTKIKESVALVHLTDDEADRLNTRPGWRFVDMKTHKKISPVFSSRDDALFGWKNVYKDVYQWFLKIHQKSYQEQIKKTKSLQLNGKVVMI